MHDFATETELCTFWLYTGALWDMGLVHCGVCVTGRLIFTQHLFLVSKSKMVGIKRLWIEKICLIEIGI